MIFQFLALFLGAVGLGAAVQGIVKEENQADATLKDQTPTARDVTSEKLPKSDMTLSGTPDSDVLLIGMPDPKTADDGTTENDSPPADITPPDTTSHDIARHDTTPPDTTNNDTTPPDTTPPDTTDHDMNDHDMTPPEKTDHDLKDHDMDDHVSDFGPLPKTPEEIEKFIVWVKNSPEDHVHDADSMKLPEHQAALDLVPRAEATHIAIGNGSWFDPENWYEGRIPDANAKVVIPDGVHITYDGVSETRLFTVRVDGELEFANDVSSKMVVDTMVVTPGAQLTIGTEAAPVKAGVDVDIVIANNGPIDVKWDPMLLSRGIISHGDVDIYGASKDSHEKVVDDPMEGDTWLDFEELPEGWEVGDKIVVAGTHYEGYRWDGNKTAHHEPEDEIRTISHIDGSRVFFDDPLVYDHDSPRDDLKTSVANYSRNITIGTENGADAEVYERGHVMFMHSDDIDVQFAEFFELGRTDKSELALNASEFENIAFDSNVKGRYAVHIHRAGVNDPEHPAMFEGNAVFGSPGWGFVHHDSNAVLDNNATYNTFGAGYVAESGNEIGSWTDNIAIYAKGVSWNFAKAEADLANFDTGKSGDGFWFQGRMVESSGNIAASVNHGFVYFHRGPFADDAVLKFDSSLFEIPGALYYDKTVTPDDTPILAFQNNEVFAAREGLHVVKADPAQGHDVHSVIDGFTAWSVRNGAQLEYTAHYVLKDFDLVARGDVPFTPPESGIHFGSNVFDMTIVNAKIDGFKTGIDLTKTSTFDALTANKHEYTIVNADIKNVTETYGHYDPAVDTILTNATEKAADIVLDGPLTYKEAWPDPTGRVVEISGSKTDSLGTTEFSAATDSYNVGFAEVINILETQGYYSNEDGSKYFLLDMYFSDRLTGEIYFETHPVFLDDSVKLGNESFAYKDAKDNGVLDLKSPQTLVSDEATLLDLLTFDQGAYAEEVEPVVHDEQSMEHDAMSPNW